MPAALCKYFEKLFSSFLNWVLTWRVGVCIIIGIQEEVNMTKKVEITKDALVRQVEQKFRLPKFALSSLERANKDTIKVILSQ